MSSGKPLDDDDIQAGLDAWDAMFDSTHQKEDSPTTPEEPAQAAETSAAPSPVDPGEASATQELADLNIDSNDENSWFELLANPGEILDAVEMSTPAAEVALNSFAHDYVVSDDSNPWTSDSSNQQSLSEDSVFTSATEPSQTANNPPQDQDQDQDLKSAHAAENAPSSDFELGAAGNESYHQETADLHEISDLFKLGNAGYQPAPAKPARTLRKLGEQPQKPPTSAPAISQERTTNAPSYENITGTPTAESPPTQPPKAAEEPQKVPKSAREKPYPSFKRAQEAHQPPTQQPPIETRQATAPEVEPTSSTAAPEPPYLSGSAEISAKDTLDDPGKPLPRAAELAAAALSEDDSPPLLPPSPFAGASIQLDFEAIKLPQSVEPFTSDREEENNRQLTIYERELALVPELGPLSQLLLETGHLAEAIGDYERADTYYQQALRIDGQLLPALRGRRQVARALGHFDAALPLLEVEMARSSTVEQRGLATWRANLLLSSGQREAARSAIESLCQEAPNPISTQLLALELALSEEEDEKALATLKALATALSDHELAAVVHLCAQVVDPSSEAAPTQPAAKDPPTQHLGPCLHTAISSAQHGDPPASAKHWAELANISLLAGDSELAGGAWWRSYLAAERAQLGEQSRQALAAAGECLPRDLLVQNRVAAHLLESGHPQEAAELYIQLASHAPTAPLRSELFAHAGNALASAPKENNPERALTQATATMTAYRDALSADPHSELLRITLEEFAEQIADADTLTKLDQARIRQDQSLYYRLRLATRLIASESYEQAAAELIKARSLGASTPILTRATERALACAGRFVERWHLLSYAVDEESAHFAPDIALARAAHAAEDMANQHLLAMAEASATTELDSTEALAAISEALSTWQSVLDFDNQNWAAHAARISLGERYIQAGGDSGPLIEALDHARSSPAITPAYHITLGMREIALHLDAENPTNTSRADDLLCDLSNLDNTEPRVLLRRFLQNVVASNWQEAAHLLLKAANANLDSASRDSLRYRAGALFLNPGEDAPRAVEALTPLLATQPDFVAALSLLRSAQRQLPGTSIFDADSSLQNKDSPIERCAHDTGDPYAQWIGQAEALEYRAQDSSRAADSYLKALEIRPRDPIAEAGFQRTAQQAKQWQKLAELAELRIAEHKDKDKGPQQAAAYCALATIDAERQEDSHAALASWQAAIHADPACLEALRAAEREYLARTSDTELAPIYTHLLAHLHGKEAAAIALEHARLGVRLKMSPQIITDDYQLAYRNDPRARRALFALEATSYSGKASANRAEIERAVAEYFDQDPTSQAAFLCRAGDSHLQNDEFEEAIAANQLALERKPEYQPATIGWRHAAATGQLWRDFAKAAEFTADRAPERERSAQLYHQAAVALMDKALDAQAAIPALMRVIQADKSHFDAFLRLRILLNEQNLHSALVSLLEDRLEVESDKTHPLDLLHELAHIHRHITGDAERAKSTLQRIVDIDPTNFAAISALADIAWELENWTEAAKTLTQSAQLTNEPSQQKDIFFRLGIIYSQYLPNPNLALNAFEKVLSLDPDNIVVLDKVVDSAMQLKEWNLALGASEKLITLTTHRADKVRYWLRVAKVYEEGSNDRMQAEKAIAFALDTDPMSSSALDALLNFFSDAGSDRRALRINLDRVIAQTRHRLSKVPLDNATYRVFIQATNARERAGARGSRALARAAAELITLIGDDAQNNEIELAKEARNWRRRIVGLHSPEHEDLLYPRVLVPGLRTLFKALDKRIAKHVGGNLKRYGVSRSDRLRSADPIAKTVKEVAKDLNLGNIEIYVAKSQPTVLATEALSTQALIIGAKLVSSNNPQVIRFLAGKCLGLAAVGLATPAQMPLQEFGIMIAALIRRFQPNFSVAGLNDSAVTNEFEKQKRLLPTNLIAELTPFVTSLPTDFNYKKVWAAIGDVGNRAGLLASGSTAAALTTLTTIDAYRDIHQAAADVRISALLQFVISEEYATLCATLDPST